MFLFIFIIIFYRNIHQHASVLPKWSSLFWFHMHINPHQFVGAILQLHVLVINCVLGEEECCLDVFCLFQIDRGPLSSNCMQDWLSWCRMLCQTVYPWASMKYFTHSAWGRISSVPTISVSVEFFVFVFCPLHMLVTTPFQGSKHLMRIPCNQHVPRVMLQ